MTSRDFKSSNTQFVCGGNVFDIIIHEMYLEMDGLMPKRRNSIGVTSHLH